MQTPKDSIGSGTPGELGSPTFGNAAASRRAIECHTEDKLAQAVSELTACIDLFFASQPTHSQSRTETYSILLMLYHPNKRMVVEHMQRLCQSGALEKQGDDSIYSRNPSINAFLSRLTRLHLDLSSNISDQEKAVGDLMLAHVLRNKEEYIKE